VHNTDFTGGIYRGTFYSLLLNEEGQTEYSMTAPIKSNALKIEGAPINPGLDCSMIASLSKDHRSVTDKTSW
jgi:hypothetical protein